MEENLLYRPPKHRGLYLDPRTKLLFLFVLSTLLFLVHENLPLNSILVLIPILLLLSDIARHGSMAGCSSQQYWQENLTEGWDFRICLPCFWDCSVN